jgi:hypothetical protein
VKSHGNSQILLLMQIKEICFVEIKNVKWIWVIVYLCVYHYFRQFFSYIMIMSYWRRRTYTKVTIKTPSYWSMNLLKLQTHSGFHDLFLNQSIGISKIISFQQSETHVIFWSTFIFITFKIMFDTSVIQ